MPTHKAYLLVPLVDSDDALPHDGAEAFAMTREGSDRLAVHAFHLRGEDSIYPEGALWGDLEQGVLLTRDQLDAIIDWRGLNLMSIGNPLLKMLHERIWEITSDGAAREVSHV
jgi:hypothetical protein